MARCSPCLIVASCNIWSGHWGQIIEQHIDNIVFYLLAQSVL